MVREEELSDPRNQGHGNGPARIPSYGHQFGALHDRIVGSEEPDESFYTRISNRKKVDYICESLRMDPVAFNLDLPFPLEDWVQSGDASLINSGLYFVDMRVQFYGALMRDDASLEKTPVFKHYAQAEFWQFEFNRALARRQRGELLADPRVLN